MSDLFEILSNKEKPKKVTTGLTRLDEAIGGFTFAGNYLVSGHRKSGKSSLLIGFINHWLSLGYKVGILNSEMEEHFLMAMMQANYFDKDRKALTSFDNEEYIEKFRNQIYYSGPSDLREDGGLSIGRLESEAIRHIDTGVQILLCDNLTKLQEQTSTGSAGWQNLASGLSTITSLCRKNNLLGISVIHTRDELLYSETPDGIAKLIEDRLPEKIFEKSVTILRKPSSASIYGGGSTKTDLLGTLLLWRPYQMFTTEDYSKLSSLIFEDFRGEAPPDSVRLIFEGAKNKFLEVKDPYEIAKDIFNNT